MVKSTFAVSKDQIGNSMTWKQKFLPTFAETEDNEKMESTALEEAIADATTVDEDEANEAVTTDDEFDILSVACGMAARVQVNTTFTKYEISEDQYVREVSHFSLHGVWAGGSGYDREVGGLTVSEVEDIIQQGLGDFQEYSPWMDIHAALYVNDIDNYVERFYQAGPPFLALRWPSTSGGRSFYSLIAHVGNTQEIFEIVSAVAPNAGLPSLPVHPFPLPRHPFQEEELEWLMHESQGPVQLHVS